MDKKEKYMYSSCSIQKIYCGRLRCRYYKTFPRSQLLDLRLQLSAVWSCLTSCCKILKLIKYQKLWHFQQMLDVFTQIVNKPVPAQLWLATKAWQIVTAIFDSKTTKTFLSFLLSNNDCVELRLRCHKMPRYNLLLLFVKVASHEWIQIWSNLCYPGPGRRGKQMPSKDFNSHKSQSPQAGVNKIFRLSLTGPGAF